MGSSLIHTDLAIDVAIASLGDWLTQAQGAVHGSISVKGDWPRLDANGKINGKDIALHVVRADSIALIIAADDLRAPSGQFALQATRLSVANYLFDTAKLNAHGKASALAVELTARGSKLAIDAAIHGALIRDKIGEQTLAATLARLDLAPTKQPAWTLQKPVAITYASGDFSLGELCLSATASRLCVAATQSAGSTQGKFSISQLPLAAIANILNPDSPTKLDGIINGDGAFTRAADGTLHGHAMIDSDHGSIAWPDGSKKPLIAYSALHLDATLAANQSSIVIRSKLNDNGHLDGNIMLGAATDTGMPLSGAITAHLENLGIVDLLSGQTASTKGALTASLKLSGTTHTPGISGDLTLADFATEVPSAGLELHDGHIQLRSNDGQTFALDGTIGSGSGKLTITGDVGAATNTPIALRIQGELQLFDDPEVLDCPWELSPYDADPTRRQIEVLSRTLVIDRQLQVVQPQVR